jgi:hypothetical protein
MIRLVTILFHILSSALYAQVYVGPDEDVNTRRPAQFTTEHFEALRNCPLIVSLPVSAKADIPVMQRRLQEGWPFSALMLVNDNELDLHLEDTNLSILRVLDVVLLADGPYGRQGNTQSFLRVQNRYRNKYGEVSKRSYCRVELDNDLNADGNLRASLVGVYLKCVSGYLRNKRSRGLYEETRNKVDVKPLEKAVLYLPEQMLRRSASKIWKAGDLMKKYPFRYKVISWDQFDSLTQSPGSPVYFAQVVVSGNDRFFTVFNAQNGHILYSTYTEFGRYLEPKDFGTLASYIR